MRFIESILFKDGVYHNLELHQKRVNRTFHHFMPDAPSHKLSEVLPPLTMTGTYKVRAVYDADQEDVDFDVEFIEYVPRKIETLEVVSSAPFDYAFKYEDRTHIHTMVQQAEADDVIISIDGKVTDGSYSNLAFWDGIDWFTPDTPLLNGVRRQQLLGEGEIKEAPIRVGDLGAFQKVSLINAMLDLGEVELPTQQLKR